MGGLYRATRAPGAAPWYVFGLVGGRNIHSLTLCSLPSLRGDHRCFEHCGGPLVGLLAITTTSIEPTQRVWQGESAWDEGVSSGSDNMIGWLPKASSKPVVIRGLVSQVHVCLEFREENRGIDAWIREWDVPSLIPAVGDRHASFLVTLANGAGHLHREGIGKAPDGRILDCGHATYTFLLSYRRGRGIERGPGPKGNPVIDKVHRWPPSSG